MNSLSKHRIILFFLSIALYYFIAKSLIHDYGVHQGLHLTFLIWSFFVVCLPIARGSIVCGVPFYLLTKRELKISEFITWPVALGGNIITLYKYPTIYFKTYLTHLFFCILSNPYLSCIVIGVCALATFYSAYMRPFANRKILLFANFLIVCSFVTTFLLTYIEFIIVLNAHGNA